MKTKIIIGVILGLAVIGIAVFFYRQAQPTGNAVSGLMKGPTLINDKSGKLIGQINTDGSVVDVNGKITTMEALQAIM